MAGQMGFQRGDRADLYREIATAARDINVRVYNGVFQPGDETLAKRGGTQGLGIYDKIEQDGHAYAVLQKRRMAVIARPWTVEPASPKRLDKRAADVVRAQLAAINFDKLTLDLLDGTLKGYAVAEVLWRPGSEGVEIHKVVPRDQRRFTFDAETGAPRMLTQTNMLQGEELPDRKFLVYSFGGKDENPFGLGLGTRLFWYTWFKSQLLSQWLVFTEKFASPTAVGEYPPGTPQAEQKKLLQAAEALSQDAAVVIPQGLVLKLLEAGRSGGSDAYEAFLRYCDEQISEIVLGETLSTSVGASGSRALGDVHNEVRIELTKADSDLLSAGPVADLARWITELNVEGAAPPTVYRDFDEPDDLDKQADRDVKLKAVGYVPTAERIREVYGDGYEPVSGTTPAEPGADRPGPAFASFAEGGAGDVVDDFAAQLDQQMPQVMRDLTAPIAALVGEVESLEELRDRMHEAFSKMDGTAFAGLMQQAMAASLMAGRYEVADGH